MLLKLAIQRLGMLVLGGAGLIWGLLVLPTSGVSDDLHYIETQLLASETFDSKALAVELSNPAAVSACDSSSQTALLLMEMRLAQAALRAGTVDDFDRHANSLETRSKQTLSCAPRNSLVWLVAFSLKILHGQPDEQALDLLEMSYETSPNEAWIGIRRIIAATPILALLSPPLREKVLAEFEQLARSGFVYEAARSYAGASTSTRPLLLDRIQRLDAWQQKSFWDEVEKIRS
ncbi:MAG TPA: hypothetical protein VG168_07835 [Bryobacteraceae bacterium]|nr:hypothetical protein [Bryobacteraceae bacterium]